MLSIDGVLTISSRRVSGLGCRTSLGILGAGGCLRGPAVTSRSCFRRFGEVGEKIFSTNGKTLISKECPRLCGRHLKSSKDYREHVSMCKGEKPITRAESKEARDRNRAEEAGRPWTPSRIQLSSKVKKKPAPEETEPETERTKTMVKCPKCDKEYNDGRGLSPHLRHAHGITASKKPAGKPPGKRRGRPPGRSAAAAVLTETADELTEKADKLDKIAEEVAALL